ncbi:MAG: T9SS type A sorting domain-containing protein [Bacteroidia bacterium]|nr:T9SS type A sorting domain-containing protein [Bacteroidia bacterium]
MKTSSLMHLGALFFTFLFFCTTSLAQSFSIYPSGKITLCHGDSIKLEASSGFASYQWNTKSTSRIITVKYGGSYICKAKDKSGKSYSDTVKVNVVKSIEPKLWFNPSNKQVCKGDSLVIEIANKFKSIRWSNKATGNRIVLKPTTSGKITVVTTDSNGCTKETKIEYTVKTCSSSGCKGLIGAWPKKVICGDRDSVILEAKSGYKSYLWDNGSTKRIRVVKYAGTYILKVKDLNGNYCYDTMVIEKSKSKLSISTYPSNTTICKGDSIALKASEGFKTYEWNTGAKTRITWVKPTQTKGYLVEAVDSFGCSYKEDVRITVKSCDDCDGLLEVGKKKVLCGDKDSIILEAKSGFKTYKWNTGSKDRILKVRKKGWYKVTATTQWGKVCKDSVYIGQGGKTLKVYSNPSPAIVCPGDKVVLEATSGFALYWWNTGHRYNRVELYPTKTKVLVVEAKDSAGCEARAEFKVIVRDTCKKKCPEIIDPWPKKVLCGKGDSIILEAKSGYKNYKWNTSQTGRILTVKSSGWYWLDFTDASGNKCRDSIYIGKGSAKSLKIDLYPKGPYCVGDSVLAIATFGFKKYWWSKGINGYPANAFIVTKTEKLVVEAEDSFGCEARGEIKLEVDTCTSSVHDLIQNSTRLVPNPAANTVRILSAYQLDKIELCDIGGRLIQKLEPTSTSVSLKINDLTPGVYLIRAYRSGAIATLRLLKE